MNITIKEVQSRKELREFIRLPHSIYQGNPYWVPALDFDEINTLSQQKNPAFEYCEAKYWLAYKDGQPVGRIAAILNHNHIEKWGQSYMRFGWVDFIDDPQVSKALFSVVENWAHEKGMQAVHGPLGFTDLDREGMLVEGFDQLGTLATNYNHAYYPQHLEQLGYKKDIDWMEYEIPVPNPPDETIHRMAEISLRRNQLIIPTFKRKKDMLRHAPEIFKLLEEEYKILYGTVPLTPKQVDSYIDQYLGFVKTDFIPLVFTQQNELVAFGIVMPSLSRALQKSHGQVFPFGFIHLIKALQKNDRADLYLIAVKSEYQGKGVNAILMDRINQVFIKHGIKTVESNPELENNANVQSQWKLFEKRQHKRRRCFIKVL
jgi:hypothetical protein